MLDGFPKAIRAGGAIEPQPATPTGDGESSPAFADLDGDNRNELVLAGSDGFVHALRPDGTELPGWPVRTDLPAIVSQHSSSPAYAGGEVSTDLGGAVLASVAVGDTNDDGVPEVYVADMEGKIYGWRADGTEVFQVESKIDFSGKPLSPFVNVRQGNTNRTQHGFIGSPVLADLDLDGRDEIVAAAMDRHVYAWHRDGTLVDGFPTLVVDEAKVASLDPTTHRVEFAADSGSEQQGAIIDTPAVGDLDGDADDTGADERPEIVVGTNEEYRAADDGGFNAAAANSSSFNLLIQLQTAIDAFRDQCGDPCDDLEVPLDPGNTRLYAINASGDPDAPLDGESPFRAGWPAKLAIAMTGLLPVVGEGVTGNPIIGSVACGGGAAPRVGAVANNGPAYVLDEDGQSCYGRDGQGRDIPLQTDGYVNQVDHPMLPAVGHPAFVDLGGDSPSFAMPAAGIMRALDLAFPEYQRAGQDFLAAWSIEGGGQLRPGFPTTMNDLQFLTGPSGRRHRRIARRGARRRQRQQGPPGVQRRRRARERGVAQGDDRLDGGQSSDRLVRDPGRRRRRHQGRGRSDPLGLPERLLDRCAGVLAVLLAALSPRQRELRQLRPRRGSARGALRGRRDGDVGLVQGARRRPALRHRRSLRGSHLRQPDRRGELRRRDPAGRRPGSGRAG